MVKAPPADGLKLSDFKLALRACARGARPEEAQEVLQHMEVIGRGGGGGGVFGVL